MTTFQFTLRLDRELTEPEEDAIEAGVPEVHSLEGGLGITEAHATVDAESFIDAVVAVGTGFPPTSGPEEWGLYPWNAVLAWFGEHFPGQQFELDRQATVADLILRARSLADVDHRAQWAGLLTHA
jgi:hypothetical protein